MSTTLRQQYNDLADRIDTAREDAHLRREISSMEDELSKVQRYGAHTYGGGKVERPRYPATTAQSSSTATPVPQSLVNALIAVAMTRALGNLATKSSTASPRPAPSKVDITQQWQDHLAQYQQPGRSQVDAIKLAAKAQPDLYRQYSEAGRVPKKSQPDTTQRDADTSVAPFEALVQQHMTRGLTRYQAMKAAGKARPDLYRTQ